MTGKRRADPGESRRETAGQSRVAGTGTTTRADRGAIPSGRVGTRRGRRQEQRQRQQRRRRIFGWVGIGIVVAAGATSAVLLIRQSSAPANPPAAAAGTSVLLQVAGPQGRSIGGMLLAQNAPDQGVEVLVPASLIASVCGVGEEAFGDILALPNGEREATQALSGVMQGVPIGASWTLTEPQLAKLVDAVGGVTVNVDATVTRPGRHGTKVVEIQRGRGQHLNGKQAVEFAAYRTGPHEDASGQLDRMQSVVQAAIDELPASASAATSVVRSLGQGAASTVGAPTLAGVLRTIASDDARNDLLATDLPVTKLDTGGSPSYDVNPTGVSQLISEQLNHLVPAGQATSITVELENGLGTPGLVPAACRALQAAGMTPLSGGNASTFGKGNSEIDVGASTVADAREGDRVAAALKLPNSDVKVSPVGQTVADVIVVLGNDYKP